MIPAVLGLLYHIAGGIGVKLAYHLAVLGTRRTHINITVDLRYAYGSKFVLGFLDRLLYLRYRRDSLKLSNRSVCRPVCLYRHF